MSPDLVVTGGDVVTPAGRTRADVVIADGLVVELVRDGTSAGHAATVDATGSLVAPGFIDVQINGGWGHDFTTDPSSIGTVAAALPPSGVTAFLPTIVTTTRSRRARALAAITEPVAPTSATPLGLHLEGPMLSPRRPGAHDPALLAPLAADEIAGWSRDAGVFIVTLAPELDGATAAIADLVARDVVVAAGHTDATAAELVAACDAGITAVTHLFNAMRPLDHREPGVVGVALTDDRLRAGLVCDGLHLDPRVVRLAWRMLGPRRTLLVTDAVAALGMPPGVHRLGDLRVAVADDGVRLVDGTLAGSDLSLDRAVRNLVAFTDCDPVDAIRTVTATPADLLGLPDRGRLAPGTRADLVVLDDDLFPRHTVIGGRTAWKS